MENDNEYYINQTIELAKNNVITGNGGPFAAIIVKDGEIISTGVNSVTSENDPTAHAEIKAIRNACNKLESFQLEDCVIYSSCEPCPMCLGAIYWARPKKIIFAASKHEASKAGFDDAYIYEEITKQFSNRKLLTVQIPVLSRTEPFNLWINKNSRKNY